MHVVNFAKNNYFNPVDVFKNPGFFNKITSLITIISYFLLFPPIIILFAAGIDAVINYKNPEDYSERENDTNTIFKNVIKPVIIEEQHLPNIHFEGMYPQHETAIYDQMKGSLPSANYLFFVFTTPRSPSNSLIRARCSNFLKTIDNDLPVCAIVLFDSINIKERRTALNNFKCPVLEVNRKSNNFVVLNDFNQFKALIIQSERRQYQLEDLIN
jgi:hypothetical protein